MGGCGAGRLPKRPPDGRGRCVRGWEARCDRTRECGFFKRVDARGWLTIGRAERVKMDGACTVRESMVDVHVWAEHKGVGGQ